MDLPPEAPIQQYTIVDGDDFTGYWIRALGWIAYYFAQLEGLSFLVIEAAASDEERPQLMSRPFQRRTEAAKNLATLYFSQRGRPEASEEWASLLDEIKAAGPLRNAILHNPFTTNMLKTQSIKEADEGIVLVRQVGQPVIKLGAVQAFSSHVLELNHRMLRLLETVPLR